MEENGIQIRLSDVLYALWKHKVLIAILTAAGFLFGLFMQSMSFLQGEVSGEYTVSASAAVVTKDSSGTFSNGTSHPTKDDITLAEGMMDAAIYTLNSKHVRESAIESLGLIGVTENKIQKAFSVGQYEGSQVIELSISWKNPDEGEAILRALIGAAEDSMQSSLGIGCIELIDEPYVKTQGRGIAKSLPSWLVMSALGFLVGIGIAMLELLTKPTLINLKDVEKTFGLEKLAVIPQDDSFSGGKKKLLSNGPDGAPRFQKKFTAAAHILQNRLGRTEGCKCFYVTSSAAGEGKTTTAASLAVQFADMERKVLLVDLDIHNPSLGSLFFENIDYSHSLNALYSGESSVAEAVTPLTGYLDILPAVMEHNSIAIDNSVFGMLRDLMPRYNYIIIDAAPVGQSADVLNLSQVADTALFVIRYDFSTIQSIQDALGTMDKSGVRVLGCVINGVRQHTQPDGYIYPKKAKDSHEESPMDEDLASGPINENTPGRMSIMDEAFDNDWGSGEEGISDADAIERLVRMGIDGSWKDGGESQEMADDSAY